MHLRNLRVRVTGNAFEIFIPSEITAANVEEIKNSGQTVDRGVRETLLPRQILLRLLALSDVFGYSGDAVELPLLIIDREDAVVYPADSSIRTHDAILHIEFHLCDLG